MPRRKKQGKLDEIRDYMTWILLFLSKYYTLALLIFFYQESTWIDILVGDIGQPQYHKCIK